MPIRCDEIASNMQVSSQDLPTPVASDPIATYSVDHSMSMSYQDPTLLGLDGANNGKQTVATERGESSVEETPISPQDEAILTSLFSMDPAEDIAMLESNLEDNM